MVLTGGTFHSPVAHLLVCIDVSAPMTIRVTLYVRCPPSYGSPGIVHVVLFLCPFLLNNQHENVPADLLGGQPHQPSCHGDGNKKGGLCHHGHLSAPHHPFYVPKSGDLSVGSGR